MQQKSKDLKSLQPRNIFEQTILDLFKTLPKGDYALVESPSGKLTQVLKMQPSHGTDFFKQFEELPVSFNAIESTKLFNYYSVPLNACPIDSDTQDFAKALVFSKSA